MSFFESYIDFFLRKIVLSKIYIENYLSFDIKMFLNY